MTVQANYQSNLCFSFLVHLCVAGRKLVWVDSILTQGEDYLMRKPLHYQLLSLLVHIHKKEVRVDGTLAPKIAQGVESTATPNDI